MLQRPTEQACLIEAQCCSAGRHTWAYLRLRLGTAKATYQRCSTDMKGDINRKTLGFIGDLWQTKKSLGKKAWRLKIEAIGEA